MISIIVVFPKLEEAKSIKNLLVRHGMDVFAACTTAAQVISLVDDLDYGIVVSGYKLADMLYDELLEYLPENFNMLLIASNRHYSQGNINNVKYLPMPIKAVNLVDNVRNMYDDLYEEERRRKRKPAKRSDEDRQTILQAKELLMNKKGMSEDEAHHYLQKSSMDRGVGMIETAHMILDIFK